MVKVDGRTWSKLVEIARNPASILGFLVAENSTQIYIRGMFSAKYSYSSGDYTPDWDSHKQELESNKHYWSKGHHSSYHDEPLNRDFKENHYLDLVGYQGTEGSLIHPTERGFYLFWKDRDWSKSQDQKHIDAFFNQYDPITGELRCVEVSQSCTNN